MFPKHNLAVGKEVGQERLCQSMFMDMPCKQQGCLIDCMNFGHQALLLDLNGLDVSESTVIVNVGVVPCCPFPGTLGYGQLTGPSLSYWSLCRSHMM